MSNLNHQIQSLHQPIDKALFRALSLLLGFMHVGLLMWEPSLYSEAIGGFNAFIAPLMILAMCSSMIFGIGFKPLFWLWQLLFSPYLSLSVLGYLTIAYFV
ncbi:cyd operon protein YbgE [Vibrio astriarenae]|uniref:cyd operon protein YbgE n=1 Tax=Vibrio astriarenae TaxID=1481923 RepID=UPI0037356901